MIELTDTHCHIHEAVQNFTKDSETRERWREARKIGEPDEIIRAAVQQDVTRMICVGTTLADSELAVDFVQTHPETWATIGIHPHEAKDHLEPKTHKAFAALAKKPKVVGVGECGLDYFYNHSTKVDQEKVLRFQIELALEYNLPMTFHVREAFDDFWSIFDEYKGIRGVIHSFTANRKVLDEILARNLYIGLNGITTFSKTAELPEAVKAAPLEKILLETDAPFLTPAPFRGTICEPKHLRVTAEFLAKLRDENFETFAKATTRNARQLFGLR